MSEPTELNVFIDPDGTLTYLHTDDFAEEEFGRMDIRRASEVEFDPNDNKWVATLMDGREIARHALRKEVLVREREIIDQMLASGEHIPVGPEHLVTAV